MSNAYVILGSLNQQSNRMTDLSDVMFVRGNGVTNQILDYFAITDINTNATLGYFLGGTAPVSGTDSFTGTFGGTTTFDDTLHVATAGANNGSLEDINSALVFDQDSNTIEDVRATVGQLQAASSTIGFEIRQATVAVTVDF